MTQAAAKIEKGEWLSESEIGKRLKLHRQTVASRLDELGYVPDPERSTAKAKIHWFDDEMEFAVKAAKDSLTAAKIRDLRVKTELNELKLAEARGELVPMGEVTDLAQRLVKMLYDEHAVRMPKRVAGQLVKAKSLAAVRKILKTDADRVFKLVRTNFERYING